MGRHVAHSIAQLPAAIAADIQRAKDVLDNCTATPEEIASAMATIEAPIRSAQATLQFQHPPCVMHHQAPASPAVTSAQGIALAAGYVLLWTAFGYKARPPTGLDFALEATTAQDAWIELCELADLI